MIYKNAQLYNVADIETDCKDGGVNKCCVLEYYYLYNVIY